MNQELIAAVEVTDGLWVCIDCMEGIEGFEEATLPARVMHDNRQGIAWAIGDGNGDYQTNEFSMNPCECCGSRLAGERHAAVTVKYPKNQASRETDR